MDPGPRLYDFVLHNTAVRCDMTNVWSRYKMNGNISNTDAFICDVLIVPILFIRTSHPTEFCILHLEFMDVHCLSHRRSPAPLYISDTLK